MAQEDNTICGLVGVAGAIGAAEERAFKSMLTLDIVRGKHSTGVASMSGMAGFHKFEVFKDKLNAVDYMDQKGFNEIMRPKSRILMGHNRWATKGAITAENAHPFEFDNIIGAHNGTLNSQYKMHEHTKYQVDSQALFSELNQNGVDEMWGKVSGAAALTWIDKRTSTLNFLRNKERPLCFAYSGGGKTLWWASEYWMILVAANREGIKVDGDVQELKVNEHLEFNVGNTDTDLVSCINKKVSPYVAPVYTYKKPDNNYLNTSGYDSGKKHLEKEGAKVGDVVEFEIDIIRECSHYTGGSKFVNVFGLTLKGVPVRIWSLNETKYPDIVDTMTMLDGALFEGRINFASDGGLILEHLSLKYTGYTIDDVLEAEEQLAAAKEDKYPPIKQNYSTTCELCDQNVRTYYLVGDVNKRRCCESCKNIHTAHEKVH